MEKIDIIKSRGVLVPISNIDTDQIIPARFLKSSSRDGFGEKLFYDWRFNHDNTPNSECILNGQNGSILVAGDNFGCGSSREHAAWALCGAGYKVVVSSSFADIFKNNALNNALLPVQVSPLWLEELTSFLQSNPESVITVDLPKQTISVKGAPKGSILSNGYTFEIGKYKKECLMKGYTDIDYLLSDVDSILKYENRI